MSTIEDRVAKLEEEVFGKKAREKNWRSTVGMFGNDPFMKDVIEGALDSREQERLNARESAERESE